jgi:hypothetical protein
MDRRRQVKISMLRGTLDDLALLAVAGDEFRGTLVRGIVRGTSGVPVRSQCPSGLDIYNAWQRVPAK